ncbi:MAG: tRNA (adenosine(37)-N6)-dimethylallyltransferase MiaA [Lachnospiraceae bacterium]|nr:tRNA (adenosine(37)-N6)-dimethylallyltransferase MiaA [Lachnospiraceae bacterium]
MKRPLIILAGPTAVGKTDLSVKLAQKIGGSIISADSMQVYKYMDIGSAKIMPEEMQGIPHYLIDEFLPEEEFNIVVFQKKAKQYMDEIYAAGRIPILAGGTGFYIQSVLYDIDFSVEDADTTLRQQLEALAREKGSLFLHQRLEQVDPESAKAIHPNNVKRVIRALEYYEQNGEPISKHNAEEKAKESPYNFVYFVLNDERNHLYERIDKRVDIMLEKGLLKEVEKLKEMGYHKGMVSMQGLGYKEILAYLDGEITLEEAVYILKRDTRHFAKRQLTWFRREEDVVWVNKEQFAYNEEKILDSMLLELKEKKIIQ